MWKNTTIRHCSSHLIRNYVFICIHNIAISHMWLYLIMMENVKSNMVQRCSMYGCTSIYFFRGCLARISLRGVGEKIKNYMPKYTWWRVAISEWVNTIAPLLNVLNLEERATQVTIWIPCFFTSEMLSTLLSQWHNCYNSSKETAIKTIESWMIISSIRMYNYRVPWDACFSFQVKRKHDRHFFYLLVAPLIGSMENWEQSVNSKRKRMYYIF